jgi:hypothetical protein
MDSIKNEKFVKIGRPSVGRSKKELKVYLKLRSREYYKTSEAKEKQRLKMIVYRNANRDKINQRKRAKASRMRLQKNLKRIWVSRGLITTTL